MFTRPWALCDQESSVGQASFVAEYGLWDDRQAAAAEQVEVALNDIDLVRVVFSDPHGLARSKTLPASVFRTVLHNGMDFSAGPFLFDTGHAVAVDHRWRRLRARPGSADVPGAAWFGAEDRVGARR
jgi:glutamine synthetase